MESLLSLDIGKAIFVLTLFLFWAVLSLRTKKPSYISFLYILIVLPFNITLQLPFLSSEDPYVRGIISNYLIPTISILDVGFVLLFISLAFERKVLSNKFFILVLGFYILIISLHPNTLSIISAFRLLFYPLSLLLFFIYTKVSWKQVSSILLFHVLFQGLLGVFQFLKGASLGVGFLGESSILKGVYGSSFINLDESLVLRAYGTFPHPNLLGGFLLFTLFYGLFLKTKLGKVISILSSIFILFTFSRIAILILLFVWFGYIFISLKGKVFVFLPMVFERFRNLVTNDDASLEDRLKLVNSSIKIFKENIIWGVGPGRFVYGLESAIPITAGGFSLLQPVHNIYLLLLSEYGLILGGIFCFLLIILLGVDLWKKDIFVKLAVIAFLVISLNDHYLVTLPQGIVLFSIALCFFIFQLKSVLKLLQR